MERAGGQYDLAGPDSPVTIAAQLDTDGPVIFE